MRNVLYKLLLLTIFSNTTLARDTEPLRQQLQTIIKPYKATVGIALKVVEQGDTLTLNNYKQYPMQSVYKFPLAMAVLHEIDEGKYTLHTKLHISKKDLGPDTWSPMREKYPEGNIDLSIYDLLYYCVSLSDNNACDLLFRHLGGTRHVQNYIQNIGISNISIVATEKQMHGSWDIQYRNWCTPMAMTELLVDFYQQKHLSDTASQVLMKLMTESSNSAKRIKGQLPEQITVAHKTGSSGAHDKSGLIAATNDVGIITLSDGQHVALSVFVSDSMEQPDTNEAIIASIAKAVFDYFAHP